MVEAEVGHSRLEGDWVRVANSLVDQEIQTRWEVDQSITLKACIPNLTARPDFPEVPLLPKQNCYWSDAWAHSVTELQHTLYGAEGSRGIWSKEQVQFEIFFDFFFFKIYFVFICACMYVCVCMWACMRAHTCVYGMGGFCFQKRVLDALEVVL